MQEYEGTIATCDAIQSIYRQRILHSGLYVKNDGLPQV